MAMKKLHQDEHAMYIVEEDPAGGLWMSVLCGGIGMYEVVVRLGPEEEAEFRDDPASLGRLAVTVSRHPTEYIDKAVEEEYRRLAGE